MISLEESKHYAQIDICFVQLKISIILESKFINECFQNFDNIDTHVAP